LKKPKSIKELCEFIWNLENKYNLLDFEVRKTKPWQFRRIEIYYLLAQKLGILEQPHSNMTNLDRLKKVWKYILNSIIYNPYLLRKKYEVAIFSHPRAKKVDGKYIDIYTYYLREELKKQNISFIEFRKPYLGEHRHSLDDNVKYLDFILLLTYFFKFFLIFRKSKNLKAIKSLQKDLNNFLGENSIDIEKYLIKESNRFKIEKFLYKLLLKKVGCKKIYVVPSYGNGALISAAKSLNIEVIELQHGTFSKYHLGYSFPNRVKELDYFPHKFMVWSEFWKNMLELPILNNNIIIKPFAYLENMKKRYRNVKKIKDRAIVLSQGAIGEQIANKILNNFDFFKDMDLIYKLHPGEYDRWNKYPSLLKLLQFKNVTLVKDIDLYKEFAKCEYQIGVFSTAIYEGVEFGCKTILLNLNGIEYMDKFIELNQNVKVI
jgi:hypothetical protein